MSYVNTIGIMSAVEIHSTIDGIVSDTPIQIIAGIISK